MYIPPTVCDLLKGKVRCLSICRSDLRNFFIHAIVFRSPRGGRDSRPVDPVQLASSRPVNPRGRLGMRPVGGGVESVPGSWDHDRQLVHHAVLALVRPAVDVAVSHARSPWTDRSWPGCEFPGMTTANKIPHQSAFFDPVFLWLTDLLHSGRAERLRSLMERLDGAPIFL